jgi:plastocyanin
MRLPNSRRLYVITALVALLFGSMGHAPAGSKPVTHTVTIDGMQFQPDALAVRPGDTVVWVNTDPFPHTVTSKAGGFDSQQIEPGASWKYRAVRTGEFDYVCSLHPTMMGRLHIEQGSRLHRAP